MNIKRARWIVALLVFVAVGVGLAVHSGTGTLSSMGWQWVASVCPLGALEAMFGSWVWVPRLIFAFLAVAFICFIVGKAFCAWACPVPHIQNLFKSKKRKAEEAQAQSEAAHRALVRYEKGEKPSNKPLVDGRHVVLGSALASAAIFGFPVFCLVCPVGLTIGEFVLFWRFVQYNEMTWALILFPIIVIVEVVIFRKWCHTLCPLGALLSLFGAANRTLRPSVDRSTCLRETKGQACQACGAACPESIDPHSNLGDRPMSECIRCGNCKTACPVAAITFPFFDKNRKKKADAEKMPEGAAAMVAETPEPALEVEAVAK